MLKDEFRRRLEEATNALIKFTSIYCYNTLSENCEYLIVPNVRTKSQYLDNEELENLSIWNKNRNKKLSIEKTVNPLHNNN